MTSQLPTHHSYNSPRSVYEVLQRLHVRPGEAGDEHLTSLYFLTHLPLFMDLTIPHLLAYLLSISCETHRNVHTGFPFLKLRLWLELLAFKVSEYCYAVACAISIGTGSVEAAERLPRQTFLYGVHGKTAFLSLGRSDNQFEVRYIVNTQTFLCSKYRNGYGCVVMQIVQQ